MILTAFLMWLRETYPKLSQSEIARKARLSQSLVNKILAGAMVRPATTDTIRKLIGAYPREWGRFLDTHPDQRQLIKDEYSWVVEGLRSEADEGETADREFAEEISTLKQILAAAPELRTTILQQLKSQLDFVRGRSAPPAQNVVRVGGGARAAPQGRAAERKQARRR